MKSNLPTCREHLATGLKVSLPAVDGQNVALEGRVKCRAIDKEAVPENMLFSGLSVASAAKYEVFLTIFVGVKRGSESLFDDGIDAVIGNVGSNHGGMSPAPHVQGDAVWCRSSECISVAQITLLPAVRSSLRTPSGGCRTW